MLEDLIKARKEKCIDVLKQKHPEFLRDGKFNTYHVDNFRIENAPDVVLEAIAWNYFEAERYWDGHRNFCNLIERNKDYFSEDDKKDITKILLSQILEGKRVASGIPLYSDTWRMFHPEPERTSISHSLPNSKEELKISPLKEYVTEQDRANAVNKGFWHVMNAMKNQSDANCAGRELMKIMDYDDFFGAFDYLKGAEEAEKLPEEFEIHENFNNWYNYMRWYMVQENYVWAKSPTKKADEINSRLAAPIVDFLYFLDEYSAENRRLKRLVEVFVDKDMIKTKPIQRVLGNVFEFHIKDGFENGTNSDHYSQKLVEHLENCLIDPKKHVKKVYEELMVGEGIDFDNLPAKLKDYLPKEMVESRVNDIRKQMEAMERIDVEVFRKWMLLIGDKDVAVATHSKVRNKALDMYFKQSPRPAGDDVRELNQFLIQGSDFIADKFKGCVVSDFLFRKRWDDANEILMDYMRYEKPEKQRKTFYDSINNYVKLHGKIVLDKKGLYPRECYPQYNIIPEFYEQEKKLFELKE